MAHFLEQLVNAVTLGAIYGLIAIGYTMVYGIIGMVNFAHGDVFMVGSFIALIFVLLLGLSAATPFFWLILALVFVLAIADKGWKRALADDPHLANGLNVWNGQLTCEPVAKALGLPFTPAGTALV